MNPHHALPPTLHEFTSTYPASGILWVCEKLSSVLPSPRCTPAGSGMKVSRLLGMSESHEVGIELDPPSPPPRISRGVFPHRIHSRSASWSFTGGPRPGTSDLSSRVTVLNPITPLTAVIREYVQQEHSSVGNSTMSRTTSEVSLPLSRVASYEDELSDAPVPPHIPSRQERRVPDIRDQRHPPHVNEEQNIGFEISDGIRWLEHNAIFIILLLVKFAWYHRSGRRVKNAPLPCIINNGCGSLLVTSPSITSQILLTEPKG